MVTYKGKPVLLLYTNLLLDSSTRLDNIWVKSTYSFRLNKNYTIAPITRKKFEDKFKSLTTSIPDGSVLFFMPNSKFPRFKLSESKFKRCIKKEKANYFVVGSMKLSEKKDCFLLEDEYNFYLIDLNDIYFSYRCSSATSNAFKMDTVKYIIDHHYYYGQNLSVAYRGPIIYDQLGSDLVELIDNGSLTNVITDEALDRIINNNFVTLDKEAVTSICQMLDSSDKTTQGLGLKILTGYNVSKTPLAVRTMLGLRVHLRHCSEWKSSGVQQILSSIGFNGWGSLPNTLYNILPSSRDDTTVYTDEDKNLVKDVYVNAIKRYMDQSIENLGYTNMLNTFGLKINYSIDEI